MQGIVVTCLATVSSSMLENDVTKLWRMRMGHMSEEGINLLSKQYHLGKHDIGYLLENIVIIYNMEMIALLLEIELEDKSENQPDTLMMII